MELDDSRAPAGPALTRAVIEPDESVVLTVVRALAAVENVGVTDLPSLGNSIDPEALEALVAPAKFTGTVTFEYDDYLVLVEAGESVAVYGDAPTGERRRTDRTR